MNSVHKDFLENPINVGDEVVYCASGHHTGFLVKRKVIGFTPKMVKTEDEAGIVSNVMPYKLVVVSINKTKILEKAIRIVEDTPLEHSIIIAGWLRSAVNFWKQADD